MIKVNRVIIKFSSVTHALRAKEIVEQRGGKAIIRKNSNPPRIEGCGYSMIVSENTDVINLLKINHVKYIGYELI